MSIRYRTSDSESTPSSAAAVGLLLAAGAGRRMGIPKGLLRDEEGRPWVARSAETLRAGGCARIVVVVGAAADEVRLLVPSWAQVVVAPGWAQGMGSSLRAGLAAAGTMGAGEADLAGGTGEVGPAVAVVTLVDLPGVGSPVVTRLLGCPAVSGPNAVAALVRAAYDGTPGHPVVLGRAHWEGVTASAHGDAGARAYLRGRDVTLVECADIGHGDDVDTPPLD